MRSPFPLLACCSIALTALVLLSVSSAAQSPSAATRRLFIVPMIGAGRDVRDPDPVEGPVVDVWTLGTQLEMTSGRSHWSPLTAAYLWHYTQRCQAVDVCTSDAWSVEAGVLHAFLPTSVLQPYGGGVMGLQHRATTAPYVQGRAGVDVTPKRSPVTLRVEARYLTYLERAEYRRPTLLVNTGIRFMLPKP